MKLARFRWGDSEAWGVVEHDGVYALTGDLYGDFDRGNQLCTLADVKLLPPARPTTMVACGRNYLGSIQDLGVEVPEEPALFFKPVSALIGPEEAIVRPAISQDLRYEAELCCVIKREASRVSQDRALDYVLGYTCGNDCTMYDIFKRDVHITRAKGFDRSGPLGPFLVTGVDPHDLAIRSRVNGETRQDSRTSLMMHSVEKLISHITAFLTLLPGDVVWTGTPGGGHSPVKPGDVTEVEIEGIGVLRNRVTAEQ